jgi:hypothetical protein
LDGRAFVSRAWLGLEILGQAQRVVDGGMPVARSNRIANAVQPKAGKDGPLLTTI